MKMFTKRPKTARNEAISHQIEAPDLKINLETSKIPRDSPKYPEIAPRISDFHRGWVCFSLPLGMKKKTC